MKDFLDKWKKDSKYRTKIKLLLYTLFVVIVSIYAISINNISSNDLNNPDTNTENNNNTKTTENVIKIPEEYNYIINITINNTTYKYSGTNKINQKTIIKEDDISITNYIYQDNEYYIDDNGIYIKTTKNEVYDIINYNYIDLETINTYLKKGKKNSNQYLVYLKDIILGNNSNEYFIILVNDNKINIDYTPLMKEFNNNIEKYKVDIKIEEIE